MAASSRAQVLRLYRALLRESQCFTAYGYRSPLVKCIPHRSLLSKIQKIHSWKMNPVFEATVDHPQHSALLHKDIYARCTSMRVHFLLEEEM
ncbi:PREDICTED: LYR motif-containing protein 4 isoform X1 [Crocodylus porosus]|uniref:LYR motif-containing protein 4 isoform X1 n=1 Tax=Crocodylus porosus TaxID=8502 RepID=UPI00093DF133|nr:PREDICTED: LYR motif-containing protein 4 isoform X1 [Crocodylus porosus]